MTTGGITASISREKPPHSHLVSTFKRKRAVLKRQPPVDIAEQQKSSRDTAHHYSTKLSSKGSTGSTGSLLQFYCAA